MKGRRPGFTLVELLVAVSILLIIGLNLYQLRDQATQVNLDLKYRQKAAWVLESQAALLRSKPYDQMAETRLGPLAEKAGPLDWPGARGAVTIEEISPGLKRIRLEVTWPDRHRRSQALGLTLYRTRP
ncbi:MAG: prepilin-type N-terminal cleavage/methylation domain-containing protein [Thermodesulfobacteriota bacterium]